MTEPKYIEIDRCFIKKKKLDSGSICILYVPTSSQLVSMLTKGLSNPTFQTNIGKLMIDNI